jgi:hypothetical protein
MPGRRFAAALALTVVAQVAAVPLAAAAPAPAPVSAGSSAELVASGQARDSGRRVEVAARRTETEQVFANPDGTFTAQMATRPVRVHRADGSWAPVDTTLRARADGRVTPVATPMDLVLSGGGTGPLVSMARAGRSLALTWPGALPAPTLRGDTATYAEVLSGVDLRVRATLDGFSDVLVVKTRQAAANPALGRIRFGLATVGVTAKVGASGELTAVDEHGRTVFAAPPATMWDSTAAAGTAATRMGDPAASTERAPGAGARRARMGVRLAGSTLEVLPDRRLLAAARFPVFVDPETTYNMVAWTEVNAYAAGSVWRTDDTRPAAGHSYDQFGTYTVRSFFSFSTASIRGAHIYTAYFRAYLWHSWSCQPRPVELWAMPGGFTAGTTWNSQPSWSGATWQSTQNVAKGYTGCAAGSISFGATTGVAKAAAAQQSAVTLGLKASDENDVYGWKKFDVYNAQTVPQLDVTYDFAPDPPAAKDLSTTGAVTSCTSSTTNPPHIGVPTAGLTLRARANDPDGTQNKLRVNYEWWVSGGAKIGGATSSQAFPGSTFTVTMPKSAVPVDQAYAWRANAQDINPDTGQPMNTTAWSPWCVFAQDSTAPNAPEVTSPDYPGGQPADGSGAGLGRAASFTFSPNGSTDIVKYIWSFGQDLGMSGTVISVAAGESAKVKITPDRPGINKLYVLSVDASGLHQQDSEEWQFEVPWDNLGPVGLWHLDESPGSANVVDSSGNGYDAPLAPGASFTGTGRVGGGAHFDGLTGTANTPLLLHRDTGYTVSAWVRLDSLSTTMTAVSVYRHDGDFFDLGYHADTHHFFFAGVESPDVAQVGVWTLLTGVHDPSARSWRLYVNGQLVGISTLSQTQALDIINTGTVQLGCHRISRPIFTSECRSLWAGDIDEVQVWERVVYPSEMVLTGSWALDGGGHDDSTYARDVAPAASAAWGGDRFGLGTGALVSTGGANSYAATAGPVVRTDASYTVSAWVLLGNKGGTYVAASQFGNRNGAFSLGYRNDLDRWVLDVPNADTDTATVTRAVANSSPPVGVWTHLVGVYDMAAHKIRLYVGTDASVPVLAQEVPYTPSWNAAGAFDLGRAKWHGAAANFWVGSIDDVRVYGDALNDYEISQLS